MRGGKRQSCVKQERQQRQSLAAGHPTQPCACVAPLSLLQVNQRSFCAAAIRCSTAQALCQRQYNRWRAYSRKLDGANGICAAPASGCEITIETLLESHEGICACSAAQKLGGASQCILVVKSDRPRLDHRLLLAYTTHCGEVGGGRLVEMWIDQICSAGNAACALPHQDPIRAASPACPLRCCHAHADESTIGCDDQVHEPVPSRVWPSNRFTRQLPPLKTRRR